MSKTEADTRKQLAEVAAAMHKLIERLHELQGHHDRLLRELLDLEGAHDQRPVAVR